MIFAVVLTLAAAATSLDEGQTRWRAMELEQALASFERAHEDADDDDERAQALVWQGVVQAELGDFPKAKAAFVQALRLDADAALPGALRAEDGEVPPRVRGLFEAARLDVEGPRPLPRDDALAGPPDLSRDDGARPAAAGGAVQREGDGDGSPLLVVGALALAGSGVALLGAAAFIDVAAGPAPLDGGPTSLACLGAGAVLVLAGGGLGVVAALAR